MQHYIGTKQIKAQAMSRQAYNDYRGWKLPDDENGADDGYLVEYTDGGTPNHKDHSGYISWSPKAQFDAAYLSLGDIDDLAPHQQRMIGEYEQLRDKADKLTAFIETDKFKSLPALDQELMTAQRGAMVEYGEILHERIALFYPDTPEYLKQDQGLEPVEYFEHGDIAKLTVPEREGMFGHDPLEGQQ